MKYFNLACVLGLMKQGRVKVSKKTHKRLQRKLEALYPEYKGYDTNLIIKDTDLVFFDEINGGFKT